MTRAATMPAATPDGAALRAPWLRAISRLSVALYGFAVVLALCRVVATLGLHVPIDPNEGWNAYHAVAALKGHLYPAPQSYLVNNYPPLSFYLVGTLAHVVGDAVVAGRIVSLVSFLVASAVLFRCARLMECRGEDAAVGALIFAAWILLGSDYVGMNDPQLLGHAIELSALLAVLRAPRTDVAAAFLFVLALFVKHNLVALPLATAVWLVVVDRRAAFRFAFAGSVFGLTGLLLFRLIYGSSLLSHLASARSYSLMQLLNASGSWFLWAVIPIGTTLVLMWGRKRDPYTLFCGIYCALAIALGIAFSGGAGVDANGFFDADIALSLNAALTLNRYRSKAVIMLPLILLPLGWGIYTAYDTELDWRDPDFWLHPMADDAQEAAADIRFLKDHKGPALCETLAWCYWAGKPAAVDVFNTGQEFATGARSDNDLIRQIETQRFAAIEFDSLAPFALTPGVHAALLKVYRIDHTDDDGVFLVPR